MQTSILHLFLLVTVFAAPHQSPSPRQEDEPQDWVFSWHKSAVSGLAFIPDGNRLISTSLRDDRISTIFASEGSSELIGGAVGKITGARSHAVAVSPDGARVAIAGFGAASVYDLKTLQEQWRMSTTADRYTPTYVMAIAFSPDSRTIACSDGVVRLWDVATKQVRAELKGHRSGVRRVALSPDGRVLASVALDRTVRLWEMESTQQIKSFSVNSPVINALSFSPGGNLLVAGGGDFLRMGEVRMWRMQNVNRQ